MIERPRWVGLHKMYEEHESEVFKLRFPDWNSYKDINWQDVKDGKASLVLALLSN